MAIDVNSTVISGAASGETFKVKYSATDILKIDSSGRTVLPNTIGFVAGSSVSSWTAWPTAATWGIQFPWWNGTSINVASCFSTATGRFTAPVTGRYIFSFNCYHYKPGGGVAGTMYPTLWVNGAPSTRRGSAYNLRMRGHGQPDGYAFDTQIQETLALQSGDYVAVVIYSSVTVCQSLPIYSHFSGFLIG